MRAALLAADAHGRLMAAIKAFDRAMTDVRFQRWSRLRRGEHDVCPTSEFRTAEQIRLEPGIVIKSHSILNGRSSSHKFGIELGRDIYLKERVYLDAYGGHIKIAGPAGIGQNVVMHGGGGLTIGSHVIMGANCYIVASNHNFSSPELPIMLQGDRAQGITIGSNVWLGGGVTVVDGVSIGSNVVIAAGVTVDQDVPCNSIIRRSRSHAIQVGSLHY